MMSTTISTAMTERARGRPSPRTFLWSSQERERETERGKTGIRIERGGIRIGETVIGTGSAREERRIGSERGNERRGRDSQGAGVAPRVTETGSEILICAMPVN